jgi:hypothetical protein
MNLNILLFSRSKHMNNDRIRTRTKEEQWYYSYHDPTIAMFYIVALILLLQLLLGTSGNERGQLCGVCERGGLWLSIYRWRRWVDTLHLDTSFSRLPWCWRNWVITPPWFKLIMMSKGCSPAAPGWDRPFYGPAGPPLGPFGPNCGLEASLVGLFDIFMVWACFDQHRQVLL